MLAVLLCAHAGRPASVATVEAMLTEGQVRQCYDTAAMFVNQVGSLEADPELFFLRGQCGYQLAKFEDAVRDLTRFVSSRTARPDQLLRALHVRGQARLRLGLLDDASGDAAQARDRFLTKQIADVQALVRAAEALEARRLYADAIRVYAQVLKSCTSGIAFITRSAACALRLGALDNFSQISHLGMQIAPRHPELLELRAEFFLCLGESEMAIRHLKTCRSVSSAPNNCTVLLRMANSFVANEKKTRDKLKKQEYEGADALISECGRVAGNVCSANSKLVGIANSLAAKLLIAQGKSDMAFDLVNQLLDKAPNSTELLLERAALLIDQEDYDGAVRDYQAVRRLEPDDKRADEGVQKVSKIQEKEKNVNFYEVLGVSKECSEEEIKVAYKAQARTWHPDRHRDPAKKRHAERMMKNLNRAYDVLSDRQKRSLYDQGVDPDSGMNQNGDAGHHFHHHRHPFAHFGGFGGFHFHGGGF
jgi:tetratricopeptide (TPR) repeat protein